MVKKDVYAVLLAGGKGTRLWPLSTDRCSKSFVRIGRRGALITETIARLSGAIGKKNTIIVVDEAQASLLGKFAVGIPKRNILVEPFGRSTASAVGLAAIGLEPDDIMVVLPTDSLIKEAASFKKTVKEAVKFARKKKDALLCIGVKPSSPRSGYGYIKTGFRHPRGIYSIDRFIEKPPENLARRFAGRKDYFWNAGMFVFRAEAILRAVKKHAPFLFNQLSRIKKNRKNKRSAYLRMKNVSIDYQIMEKAKNLYCAVGKFSWHDLGSWKSLGEILKKDKNGNVSFGRATLMNTADSVVYNSTEKNIGLAGLKDTIVVCAEGGTLVCGKNEAERVKELVMRMHGRGARARERNADLRSTGGGVRPRTLPPAAGTKR